MDPTDGKFKRDNADSVMPDNPKNSFEQLDTWKVLLKQPVLP